MDNIIAPDEGQYFPILSRLTGEYFDNKTDLESHYRHLQENYKEKRSLEEPYFLPQEHQKLLSLSKNADNISEAIKLCLLKAQDLRTALLEFIPVLDKDYPLTFRDQAARIRKTQKVGGKEETLVLTNEN